MPKEFANSERRKPHYRYVKAAIGVARSEEVLTVSRHYSRRRGARVIVETAVNTYVYFYPDGDDLYAPKVLVLRRLP